LTDVSGPLPFIPITPCRVVDTRIGSGFSGGYGPPALVALNTRQFTVGGQCGIPAGAAAVSYEFTAVNMTAAGNFRAWQGPTTGGMPTASVLNWTATMGVAGNGIVIPLGGGVMNMYLNGAGGSTVDLVLDVNGYYASTPAAAHGFVINSGAATAGAFFTTGGAEAIDAYCLTPSSNCWSYWTSTGTGNYSAVLGGGRGMTTSSSDDTFPAIAGTASGQSAYGGDFQNTNATAGNGLHAGCTAGGCWSLYVSRALSSVNSAYVEGLYDSGDLVVTGSKSGYVVDVMKNADVRPLELGDVVVAVGSSDAVLGEIPVATVRLADQEYDTAVVGVVDAPVYVPTPEIMQAYAAQEAAVKKHDEYKALTLSKSADRTLLTAVEPALPAKWIAAEMVSVHRDLKAQQAVLDGHLYVVTLGAFKKVKVDASYGAIRPGDLLTTSSTPGYAMKVSNRRMVPGAIIGKALGSLDAGTGLIPVLVTLH
jgi:hypothetical protein